MSQTKYYKIVRREGNKLLSAIAYGKAEVEYIPYHWVSAPNWLGEEGYGLTVFESFEDAQTFLAKVKSLPKKEIWECEAEGLKEPNVPLCYMPALGYRILSELFFSYPWPQGTMMAKRVKLIRHVEKGAYDDDKTRLR